MDQPEDMMRNFDIIDSIAVAIRKEAEEKAQRDAELARLRRQRG